MRQQKGKIFFKLEFSKKMNEEETCKRQTEGEIMTDWDKMEQDRVTTYFKRNGTTPLDFKPVKEGKKHLCCTIGFINPLK